MDSDKKGIWQIRLATLSIFVLGFVAGAFALHSYHLWTSAAKPPTKQERYEEVFNQLGLSENQKADVRKIVGETRDKLQKLRQESDPRVQEIRAQHDEQLQKVLTPEQWQSFQQEREKIRQTEKTPAPPKQLNIQ
jgi:Spy/CpxP family protein refolding chaperone